MRSRASRITATLALLICVVCPVLEMFDHWDHTLQTGNDTEYALVVLALCVGVAYSFARFILKPALVGLLAKIMLLPGTPQAFFVARGVTLLLSDATSPPPLALRI